MLVVFVVAAAGIALAQDNWLGGTGNWSNGANWSSGLPGPGSDVLIDSGSNDYVFLDTSPTVNSITLSGSGPDYHWVTDGGSLETLTITGSLTIGQSHVTQSNGGLYLYGGTAVRAGAKAFVLSTRCW
jgi:hypothetical protein